MKRNIVEKTNITQKLVTKLKQDRDALSEIENDVKEMELELKGKGCVSREDLHEYDYDSDSDMEQYQSVKEIAKKKALDALETSKTNGSQNIPDDTSDRLNHNKKSFITESSHLYKPTKLSVGSASNKQPFDPNSLHSMIRHNQYKSNLSEIKAKRIKDSKILTQFKALPNPQNKQRRRSSASDSIKCNDNDPHTDIQTKADLRNRESHGGNSDAGESKGYYNKLASSLDVELEDEDDSIRKQLSGITDQSNGCSDTVLRNNTTMTSLVTATSNGDTEQQDETAIDDEGRVFTRNSSVTTKDPPPVVPATNTAITTATTPPSQQHSKPPYKHKKHISTNKSNASSCQPISHTSAPRTNRRSIDQGSRGQEGESDNSGVDGDNDEEGEGEGEGKAWSELSLPERQELWLERRRRKQEEAIKLKQIAAEKEVRKQ